MRVFVAGATGAIGKQLVPRLVAAGHEVHGHDPQRVKAGDAPTSWAPCRWSRTRLIPIRSRRPWAGRGRT